MALTADEILVRMMVNNQDYINKMKQSGAAASDVKRQMDVLRETLGKPLPQPGGSGGGTKKSLEDMGVAAAEANKEVRNLQFTLPNLAAQINDIGVTAAGGMQPWLIALQQGTQLNQAFAGQSAQQIYKGLGGAIMSVISPTSLLTLGLVAASAAVVQFGIGALRSGEQSKTMQERIDELATTIEKLRDADKLLSQSGLDELRDKYGVVTQSVMDLVEAQRQLSEFKALKELNDLMKDISKSADASTWQNITGGFAFTDEANAVVNLRSQYALTTDEAKNLYAEMQNLKNSKLGSEEQLQSVVKLRDYFMRIYEYYNQMGEERKKEADAALEMAQKMQDAANNTQMLKVLTDNLPGGLSDAADEAKRLSDNMEKALQRAQDLLQKGKNAQLDAAIEANYPNDAGAQAAAKARAEFDQTVGKDTGMDAMLFNTMREAYAESAKNAAVQAEENKKSEESIKEAAREAKRAAEQLEKDNKKAAEKTEELRQQAELQATINEFGEKSIEVARQKQVHDRETFELWVKSLTVSQDTKDSLMASFDAAQKLSDVDLVSGLRSAADEAARIARELRAAVDASFDLANSSVDTLQLEQLKLKYRKNPEELYVQTELAKFDQRTKNDQNGYEDHVIQNNRNILEKNARETAAVMRQRRLEEEADREAERNRKKSLSAGDREGKRQARALDRSDNEILKEIASTEAQTAAIAALGGEYDRYGISIEAAGKEAEIMQTLMNAGVPITEQTKQMVSELADRWKESEYANRAAREEYAEFTGAVDEGRSTLENSFVGLVTGANSFRDALSNVLAKLAEMAASRAFSVLWGGSAGDNMLASFFKGIGLFDVGGYTGPGGVKEPAGIVHRGEVVFSQADVARAGGVGAVEAMRLSGRPLAGYDTGGVVAAPPASLPVAQDSRRVQEQKNETNFFFSSHVDGAGNFVTLVRDEANRIVAEHIATYDANLPNRVQTINNDPWRR